MTEEHDTSEWETKPVGQNPISHVGEFEAVAHTSYIEGPVGMAAVEHVGDIVGVVLLDDSTGVVITVETEDDARQSTALDLSPGEARDLAKLLVCGAHRVEDLARARDDADAFEEHRD